MICYFTNIWTHYINAIGRELAAVFGEDNFRIVLTRPVLGQKAVDAARAKMNWGMRPPDIKWLVQPPESQEQLDNGEYAELMRTCEVAMVGALQYSKPLYEEFLARLNSDKITFVMNERFFKNPLTIRDFVSPRFYARCLRWRWQFWHKNVYYMPAAYHACDDAKFLHLPKGKAWSWAYFPEVSDAPLEKSKSDKLRICWAGRMLKCKRVEYIVQALALLPKDKLDQCQVTIVGEGESKEMVVRLAKETGVDRVIDFKPLMTTEEVVSMMKENDVYVFPSDRGEGWGIAPQEAMDRCCVPIGNEQAGVTRKCIKDGVCGFVFEDGDIGRIAEKLEWLIDHPEERRAMGLAAWKEMQRWSPREGARRFAILLDAVKSGDFSKVPQDGGLCSQVW